MKYVRNAHRAILICFIWEIEQPRLSLFSKKRFIKHTDQRMLKLLAHVNFLYFSKSIAYLSNDLIFSICLIFSKVLLYDSKYAFYRVIVRLSYYIKDNLSKVVFQVSHYLKLINKIILLNEQYTFFVLCARRLSNNRAYECSLFPVLNFMILLNSYKK